MRRCLPSFRYFDLAVKHLQRDRAARGDPEGSRGAEFLQREFAAALADRLDDIQGRSFERVLDLGAGSGAVTRELLKRDDVKTVFMVEGSEALLRRDGWTAEEESRIVRLSKGGIEGPEWDEAVEDGSLDLVVSCHGLQWCNEVDLVMGRLERKLKRDRPFVGCMWGQETLRELRSAMVLAEMERAGGVARARMSPLAGPQDVANALQRAGMSLATLDSEQAVIRYASPTTVLEDLFLMGERAAPASPQGLRRDSLLATMALYKHLFSAGGEEANVTCSWNAIWWIAWTYSEEQPKPKARGSAKRSFTEL